MTRDVQKLLGPWTLKGAILERVEKEALAEWALKEDAPFTVIPPATAKPLGLTALHVLKSQLRQLVA